MSPNLFFRSKVIQPVIQQMTQGLSPEKLALTIAIGFVIAVIPLIGATTVLCTVAAIALALNQPVIQIINYFSAPLQVIFLFPFFRAGEWLFRETPLNLRAMEIVTLVTTKPLDAISVLWTSTWHALVVWLLLAPVLGTAIYFSSLLLLRATGGRFRREPVAPAQVPDAG